MKTDPTPQITGAAGTALSHAAIEFGRNSSQRTNANPKRADTISDTLETSARDVDGRQPLNANQSEAEAQIESNREEESTGGHLDLTA